MEKRRRSTKFKIIGLAAIVAVILVTITGCATAPNGFSQFYQDRAGASITNAPPYSGSTKILTAATTNDWMELYRNGYSLLGLSAFQGPSQANSALLTQAKRVGADVVLFSCSYLGSEQVAVPRIQYNPGQSSTTTSSGTVNANAWGSGGSAYGTANYYGNSTTTSPGTFSTQVIPITVQRYQYEAGFYRKIKPQILGIIGRPLPSEIRQQLERNTGVYVWIVRNDTPAFNANILEGDVILKMNGEDVSVSDFAQKYLPLAGQKVDIEIWRNGQFKTISVQLNNAP